MQIYCFSKKIMNLPYPAIVSIVMDSKTI